MAIRPPGSKQAFYEWRFSLKEGDQVDYYNDNNWTHATITDIR